MQHRNRLSGLTAKSPLNVEYAVKRVRVCHLVSECKKLAQKEYKRRRDNVARIIHWKLCELHQLERRKSGMNMHKKVLWRMVK